MVYHGSMDNNNDRCPTVKVSEFVEPEFRRFMGVASLSGSYSNGVYHSTDEHDAARAEEFISGLNRIIVRSSLRSSRVAQAKYVASTQGVDLKLHWSLMPGRKRVELSGPSGPVLHTYNLLRQL